MAWPAALENEWRNVAEAAAFLGVSPLTLRKWSNEGKVPVYRTPGGHRRYRLSDLQSSLEDMREKPFQW